MSTTGGRTETNNIPQLATSRFVNMCLADCSVFSCSYFIYLNWMPTYFSVIFDMDVRSSSYLSFLPWTVSRKEVCSALPVMKADVNVDLKEEFVRGQTVITVLCLLTGHGHWQHNCWTISRQSCEVWDVSHKCEETGSDHCLHGPSRLKI